MIDCHSDVMIDVFRRRRAGERAALTRVHLPRFAAGGVVAIVCTVGGDFSAVRPFGSDKAYRSTVAMLDALYAEAEESDGRVQIVHSATDLAACLERGSLGVVPAIEGASPFEGELGLVQDLYERGLRVVGLTWNSRNELAVGINSGRGGLTDAGVQAVRLMNELGMVIDLAHASPSTFWDVAEITRAPLYISHANAKAVHNHPRNLDNDQLAAIARSGGAVGLVLLSLFVAPRGARLSHVLDHLEFLRDTVGDDSVVIGADFVEFASDALNSDRSPHADLYVGFNEAARHPAGIESVAFMQNLIAAMRARRFDPQTIEKIALLNFLRVFADTQAIAGASRPA